MYNPIPNEYEISLRALIMYNNGSLNLKLKDEVYFQMQQTMPFKVRKNEQFLLETTFTTQNS